VDRIRLSAPARYIRGTDQPGVYVAAQAAAHLKASVFCSIMSSSQPRMQAGGFSLHDFQFIIPQPGFLF
jgi:hypothetical protein